jgi:hypothetical protein
MSGRIRGIPKGGWMPKELMIEELHVSFFVARRMPESKAAAARRVLAGGRFAARVLRATKSIAREIAALNDIRITVSR